MDYCIRLIFAILIVYSIYGILTTGTEEVSPTEQNGIIRQIVCKIEALFKRKTNSSADE